MTGINFEITINIKSLKSMCTYCMCLTQHAQRRHEKAFVSNCIYCRADVDEKGKYILSFGGLICDSVM